MKRVTISVNDETIRELKNQLSQHGFLRATARDVLKVIRIHFETDLTSGVLDNFVSDLADSGELYEALGDPKEGYELFEEEE